MHAEGVGARAITKTDVTVAGIAVPGYQALVAHHADGSCRPLSIVSRSYGVLQDSDFFQILETVYQGHAVIETAGTLRGGRRVWALAKHGAFEVVKDDRIEAYDLWLNTHDGSACFELHRTNVRAPEESRLLYKVYNYKYRQPLRDCDLHATSRIRQSGEGTTPHGQAAKLPWVRARRHGWKSPAACRVNVFAACDDH